MTASFLSRTLLAALVAGSTLLTACGGGSGADTGTNAANAPAATGTPGSSDTTTANTGNANAGSTDTGAANTDATPGADAQADAAQADADDQAELTAMAQAKAQAANLGGTAVLAWKPNANVVSYRVYYGTSSRSYLQPLGGGVPSVTPALTLSGLTSGQTYFFSVTGVDANGKETAYSDEMTKLIS